MNPIQNFSPDEIDNFAVSFMEAPIGLVMADYRVIQHCNHAFCEMFGFPREEVIGASMAKFYASHGEFEHVGEIWGEALRNKGCHDDIRVMQKADGTLFWVRGRGKSLTPDDPFARGIWTYSDLSGDAPILDLTQRERQVAILVVEGKSAKEIARVFDLSPRTIEAHCVSLMKKYQVRNKGELISRLAATPLAEITS